MGIAGISKYPKVQKLCVGFFQKKYTWTAKKYAPHSDAALAIIKRKTARQPWVGGQICMLRILTGHGQDKPKKAKKNAAKVTS